jgi:hypothetical protein
MSTVLKKLRIKDDMSVQLLNAPGDYEQIIESATSELSLIDVQDNTADCVHLFVKDFAEFNTHLPRALKAIKHDGLFWISYPKGTSKIKTDINRDSMWKASADFGIRPVSQVSLGDIWSAVRFRPFDAVGK